MLITYLRCLVPQHNTSVSITCNHNDNYWHHKNHSYWWAMYYLAKCSGLWSPGPIFAEDYTCRKWYSEGQRKVSCSEIKYQQIARCTNLKENISQFFGKNNCDDLSEVMFIEDMQLVITSYLFVSNNSPNYQRICKDSSHTKKYINC